jgi:hypothetical protein
MIWFKDHHSIVARYNLDTDMFDIKNAAESEG